MKTLIDGDVLVYRTAHACQDVKYRVVVADSFKEFDTAKDAKEHVKMMTTVMGLKPTDVHFSKSVYPDQLSHTLHTCKVQIQKILDRTGATSSNVYLTQEDRGSAIRVKIDRTYKANRTDPKPYHYNNVREYLINHWNAKVVRELEADDALGIAQCGYNIPTCIASIDKDLLMIPGNHYNFVTEDMSYISNREAEINFLEQMVRGDRVDNIPSGYSLTGRRVTKSIIADIHTRGGPGVLDYFGMDLAVTKENSAWYKLNTRSMLEKRGKLLWIRRSPDDEWTLDRLFEELPPEEDPTGA